MFLALKVINCAKFYIITFFFGKGKAVQLCQMAVRYALTV